MGFRDVQFLMLEEITIGFLFRADLSENCGQLSKIKKVYYCGDEKTVSRHKHYNEKRKERSRERSKQHYQGNKERLLKLVEINRENYLKKKKLEKREFSRNQYQYMSAKDKQKIK